MIVYNKIQLCVSEVLFMRGYKRKRFFEPRKRDNKCNFKGPRYWNKSEILFVEI